MSGQQGQDMANRIRSMSRERLIEELTRHLDQRRHEMANRLQSASNELLAEELIRLENRQIQSPAGPTGTQGLVPLGAVPAANTPMTAADVSAATALVALSASASQDPPNGNASASSSASSNVLVPAHEGSFVQCRYCQRLYDPASAEIGTCTHFHPGQKIRIEERPYSRHRILVKPIYEGWSCCRRRTQGDAADAANELGCMSRSHEPGV